MRSNVLKILLILLGISVLCLFAGCAIMNNDSQNAGETLKETIDEGYLDQILTMDNGVEFTTYDYSTKSELNIGYTTYTTNDKFLIINVKVYNGSKDTFEADATDAWLIVNNAKLNQLDIVKRISNGFSNIRQSATTTQTYQMIYEIGADINVRDCKLIISNGKIFDNNSVKVHLSEAPKDCKINYIYGYNSLQETTEVSSYTEIYILSIAGTRPGYNFLGWFTDSKFTGNALGQFIRLKEGEEISLYAKWEAKDLQITYFNNEYEGSNTFNAKVGETITLMDCPFTKPGYTFLGWVTDRKDNDIINAKAEFTIPEVNDLRFYAKWKKDILTVDDFNLINKNPYDHYELMNNIDFNFNPVNTIEIFYGEFNGNGHILSNLSNCFIYVNAGYIYNLTVDNLIINEEDSFWIQDYEASTFICSETFALQVAWIKAAIPYNMGKLSNIKASVDMQYNFQDTVYGGLVGVNSGIIENSVSEIKLVGVLKAHFPFLMGGFCAYNYNGKINNSYSIGTMEIFDNYDGLQAMLLLGGFCGKSENAEYNNCYSNVSISIVTDSEIGIRSKYYGGFLGFAENSLLTNCFTTGQMSIEEKCDVLYAGGLIGYNENCIQSNCFRNKSELNIDNVCYEGTEVDKSVFSTLDFYLKNDILQVYIDDDYLNVNKNAVWIIQDGNLPKLYWED